MMGSRSLESGKGSGNVWRTSMAAFMLDSRCRPAAHAVRLMQTEPSSEGRRASGPLPASGKLLRLPRPILAALLAGTGMVGATPAFACDAPVTVCTHPAAGSFALITAGRPVAVVVDAAADSAVRRVADALAADAARVAGVPARPALDSVPTGGPLVVIGVLGQSRLIDGLVADGRIPSADIAGRWEAFRQIVVEKPFPGVPRALVIVGSDRRGAVFGAYDISEKIGVSPWSWWADVPVVHRPDLYLTAGQRSDAPKVRYRGLFINDEEPAFGTWARKKFGEINAALYEHVFDLTLRLKGNYLWPAMWGKSIALDDPRTMPLADAMGLVLGTSHHEPMTRAQEEWHRAAAGGTTGGKWDYVSNGENLRAFWRGGIERMMSKGDGKGYDQLVTVGMRGDGDEPMAKGTAIGLLERIVRDQRRIIADVTRRPAEATPQVWALYKEVQDYYDAGMKVPDDVTLLFADDNWGQVRRLPTAHAQRPGGYGVYYHFDYVGGPRSYKWLNTVQIEKTWQQMDLSYRRGARSLWIVNVGDIKPMEFPLDFFLRMAWNPEAMTSEALAAFPRQWASANFGTARCAVIGDLVSEYSRLAARRKPELLDAGSYPLGAGTAASLDGGEFGRIVGEWDALHARMEATRGQIPPEQRDAFFQLVEHPIDAMTNLHRLYYAVAWNRRLAAAGDPRANVFADQAEAAFRKDQDLRRAYHALGGGKWDGMMLQTHIGYTAWNDPKTDIMPELRRVPGATGVFPSVTFRPSAPPARDPATAEAADFIRLVPAAATSGESKGTVGWRLIPRLGNPRGALAAYPQGAPATTVQDNVRAEYRLSLARTSDAVLRLSLLPTLDTTGGKGQRIAISIDGSPPQTATLGLVVDSKEWENAVRQNAATLDLRFPALRAGPHTVTLWRIDDNILVQKLALLPAKDAGK